MGNDEQARITIVHPGAEDRSLRLARAPRLGGLAGMRIALIDNSKRNADNFLDDLRTLLGERYGVAGFDVYKKASPSIPTPPDVLQRMAAGCDALVHGVAD